MPSPSSFSRRTPLLAALAALLLVPAAEAATADVDWISLPGGIYMMGGDRPDEEPRHDVKVKPFDIARTRVTFRQYRACVAAGACTADHATDGTCSVYRGNNTWTRGKLPPAFTGDDMPVVCVDKAQAAAFSAWVGGRLPTEAEWEYAARDEGRKVRYPWGNRAATCSRAVMDDGGPGCGKGGTEKVGSKPEGRTAQGVLGMVGNTWQWTQDAYHENYDGAPADGSAWAGPGPKDVIRGGSWYSWGRTLLTYYRGVIEGNGLNDDLGFRPVRDALR